MKLNVGILRGGPSPEYETSIRSGGQALLHIDREKYRPVDLLVGRDGIIHADGAPIDPNSLRSIVDVVLNMLHGGAGEDGTVQKILDDLEIPHTGSGFENILNKHLAKEEFKGLGVRTPTGVTYTIDKDADDFEEFVVAKAKESFNRVSPPWIIKPTKGGSSAEVFIAYDFNELLLGIREVLRVHDHVLVEEYVKGREVTLGWVGNFRGKENYFTVPAEIKKPAQPEGGEKKILDSITRRNGDYKTISPKDLTKEKEVMQDFMIKAKNKIGLKHYFTADFVVTPFGVYVLEIDSLPAIDEQAVLPRKLEAVGSNLTEFLDHILTEAMK
jgi:D-alanine-D-alanine ligase